MKAWRVGFVLLLSAVSASAQTLLPELTTYRAQYPTPLSKPQLGELLTRTAQTDASLWALLRKPSGNNCPAMAVLVSCDYLIYVPSGQGYDVLIDQEGQAIPTWNAGSVFGPADFVRVTGTTPPPDPPDPPDPPVPSPDHDVIEANLEALTDLVGEMQAQLRAEHATILRAVEGLVLPPVTPAPVSPVVTPPGQQGTASLIAEVLIKYVAPALGAAVATWWATRGQPVPVP